MKRFVSLLIVVMAFAFHSTVMCEQKKAPDFALKTANGKVVTLSNYRGKVVVVNFWATWCKPCREEIPDFIRLYRKYKKQGVEFIGIFVDEDGWDSVKTYIKKSRVNYPIVMQDDSVVLHYGDFSGIPTTFVIDGEGMIVFEQTGMMTKDLLESKLKLLLKKRS